MFAPRYFGVRHYAPRYFAPGADQVIEVPEVPERQALPGASTGPREAVEIRIAFEGTSTARVLDRPLVIEIGTSFKQRATMRVLMETTEIQLDPSVLDAEDDDAIVFGFVTAFLSRYVANGEPVNAVIS